MFYLPRIIGVRRLLYLICICFNSFYQLYAYGQKYLGGRGSLMLIYPAHADFSAPLPTFEFDAGLPLDVMPFNLETDTLEGWRWWLDERCGGHVQRRLA